ncbi:hypothetical protein KXD40_004957 [Peronospora effusa]|nr:hypothetical protein KXD40_004957 [Peronospora effusa]
MIDVGIITLRKAQLPLYRSTIHLPSRVLAELKRSDGVQLMGPKGPIITTAVIEVAKQTSLLVRFCHALLIEDCQVRLEVVEPDVIEVES